MNSKGTILAVDDTPASLKLLMDILSHEGYQVRTTISGELALRAAVKNPPDLVLLDVRSQAWMVMKYADALKHNRIPAMYW